MSRRVNRWLMPVVALALFFGTVLAAQVSGTWVTSGRGVVAGAGSGAGSGAGQGGGAGGTGGSGQVVPAAGSLGSADLKGWMTLQQAADGLGMPLADLVALIAPPAGVTLTGETAFKDVEGLVPGFSLTDLRPKVDARVGR
jgi:hypothetical protein